MKVSRSKRAYLVGKLTGQAISAIVELFYQERTALGFVVGLLEEIEKLHRKRQRSYSLMLERERLRRRKDIK